MTDTTITWYNSESELHPVLNFCKASQGDNRPGAVNMDFHDWEDKPHTILHHLFVQKTYDTGSYGLLARAGQTVAASGYYQTGLSPYIYMCASRSYTALGIKDGYNYLQGQLWHAQLDRVRKSQGKIAVVSFNHYNRPFIDTLVRINDPSNWKTSFQKDGLWYRKPGKRIQPLKVLPYAVEYQYTKQWILYVVFDPEYEVDFLDTMRSIRA